MAEMSTRSNLSRLFGRTYKSVSTWLASILSPSSDSLHVRLSRNLFFLILGVALVPCLILGAVAYFKTEKILDEKHKAQLTWQMRSTQKSLDQFLGNHIAALCALLRSHGVEQLTDQEKLEHIFPEFRMEFPNFVDLGLIDSTGVQKAYQGPYNLLAQDYRSEEWFHEVVVRGSYISDVFLGYRQIPHVAMAIKSVPESNRGFWIVRATIDADAFDKIARSMNSGHHDDTLIINKKGFLQNTSRFHGDALTRLDIPITAGSDDVVLIEGTNPRNEKVIMAYTGLRTKDWTLAFVQPFSVKQGPLYALRRLISAVSLLSLLAACLFAAWIARSFSGRLKLAEQQREALLQEIEQTNKLASIGRLAAGVAHEINNPMAIINEKAGLMRDLTEMSDDFANKERFLDLLRSIHSAVVRCRAITHRLLGFARQMQVAPEQIDLNALVREVMGFLERAAFHREISIDIDLAENLPHIKTDRGQLQQVFLNIINNAMDAVEDGGTIRVSSWSINEDKVGVKISDSGCGIPPEKLKRIFDPFFTTKDRGKGTGLGLSITYGIVTKLGGKISVESDVDKGTAFTVELPRDYRF